MADTKTNMTHSHKAWLILLVALALSSGGCDGFLDINEDPNSATEVSAEALFPPTLATMGSNRTIELSAVPFFAQTWASSGAAGVFNSPEVYSISPFTTGNTWSQRYIDANKNMQLLIAQAKEAEPARVNQILQASLIQQYNYLDLTVLFGSIPYTEANNPNIDRPQFDDQETVLLGIAAKVDTALMQADIGNADLPGVQNGDLIYDGDLTQWVKFGNSLKLKALMLAKSGGSDVDSEISALIDEGNLIESIADQALIPFFDTPGNENGRFQLFDDFSSGDNIWYDAGEALVDLMNDLDDPRRPTYFQLNDADEYVGSPPGALGTGDFSAISLNVNGADYPNRLITAAEILLLEAEFFADQGQLDAADEKFRAGIRASMDFFDGRPGTIEEADEEAYVNSFASLSSVGQGQALTLIHQQQYIDLFERGVEVWTQQRRTGVPQLDLPQNAVLGSLIQRYQYPPDVVSNNPNTPDQSPLTQPLYFAGGN